MAVTWMDFAVLFFLAVGAVRGLGRGLVREGMAFAGLAVGVTLAAQWYHSVAGALRPFIGDGRMVNGLAYLLVVLAVLGAATTATVLLLRLRKLLALGGLDRLGGAVFGAGQGAVLAAVGLVLLLKYPVMDLDRSVRDSGLAVELLRLVARAIAYLPPELAPMLDLIAQQKPQ